MSVDYAAGLSDYDDLGVCGISEILDSEPELEKKICTLTEWISLYQGSCVVHVGAGISTSAGIPDFRGPNGVWTKKMESESKIKEEKPHVKQEINSESVTFDTAKPTATHLALKKLVDDGYVSHIISQNVDGLFLKTNIDRSNISELHGNFYLDECTRCKSRYIRSTASSTMGLKKSNVKCPKELCSGKLRDTILDWESPIPYGELRTAKSKCRKNRLHICIGTTMQLQPANQLPLEAFKKLPIRGKMVFINLQPTKLEKKADLSIHHYSDVVMKKVISSLQVSLPEYEPRKDPTKSAFLVGTRWKSSKT